MRNEVEIKGSKLLYAYGVSDRFSDNLPHLTGVDGKGEVYPIVYQDLVILVSNVSKEEFGEEGFNGHLKDLKWSEAKILAHERVLESVMVRRSLLPLRFGTIFQDEQSLLRNLSGDYQKFLYLLEKVRDGEEWGVKVYCDLDRFREGIRKRSPAVKEYELGISGKTEGLAYLMRKKMDEIVDQEVEREFEKRLHEIYTGLSRLSKDSRIVESTKQVLTEREQRKDIILNGAFLVLKKDIERFSGEVERSRNAFSQLGWEVEQVGPFPPYHFCGLPQKETRKDESCVSPR